MENTSNRRPYGPPYTWASACFEVLEIRRRDANDGCHLGHGHAELQPQFLHLAWGHHQTSNLWVCCSNVQATMSASCRTCGHKSFPSADLALSVDSHLEIWEDRTCRVGGAEPPRDRAVSECQFRGRYLFRA